MRPAAVLPALPCKAYTGYLAAVADGLEPVIELAFGKPTLPCFRREADRGKATRNAVSGAGKGYEDPLRGVCDLGHASLVNLREGEASPEGLAFGLAFPANLPGSHDALYKGSVSGGVEVRADALTLLFKQVGRACKGDRCGFLAGLA